MLRACVLDFVGSWDSKLHLMEFAYNNNYQTTCYMANGVEHHCAGMR